MNMNQQIMLETPLDCDSLNEWLGEIEYYPYDHEESEHYFQYEELFNELSIGAADLSNDLEALLIKVDYTWGLPRTRREAVADNYTGSCWIDTAISLIYETDMECLMKNSGFVDEDAAAERMKSRRYIERLPKSKIIDLLTEVNNFLMRFMRLLMSYQTIRGIVAELDDIQAFVHKNGVNQPPVAADVT